ncbi:MAG: M56 family metallopeptidase [Eubacterium sp.]|nr:M56 family metallopeptidase [Eubacterium sp.]
MNELLLKLIDMSIKASILIAMILVVRIVFKKIPRKYICVLWALVAIRLVCPVSLESPFSAYTVVDKEVKQNTYIHQMVQPELKPADQVEVEMGAEQSVAKNEEVHSVTEVEKKKQQMKETSQETISATTWIWLFGVIAMILYGIASYLRIKRKVRASLKKEKNLYICDEIDSPFILGFIRPNIYVHSGLNPESLEYIVEHEKAHIKRKDYLWKPLGFLLLAIYWFNPMCWLAYMMLCRDIEVACDEKVIAQMDDQGKAKYSEILLKCSAGRRNIMVCPIAFGEVGVKGRIKSILSYKKPTFWIIMGSIVICVIITALFMTNPVTKSANKKSVEKETTTKAESSAQMEKGKLVQEGENFKVYDISENKEDEVTYKYQYFIYDQSGKEIDSGIWEEANPYDLEVIGSDLLRAKKTGGSNAWYSIYYDLVTAEKSQEFNTPVVEIQDYVGLLEKKGDTVYLVVRNMFDEAKKEKYELGTENYIPGVMDVKYEEGKIIIIDDGSDKIRKEIDVRNLIPKQELTYEEQILEDIYIDNLDLMVMNSGRFIEDIKKMYEPSRKNGGEYFYNINGGKQLKITTYSDGRIKGMYYDNRNKINRFKYELIKRCKNIEQLEKCVGKVYVFRKDTTILNENKDTLENPSCEICFDNYDTCRILFDKEGKIVDCVYVEYAEKR